MPAKKVAGKQAEQKAEKKAKAAQAAQQANNEADQKKKEQSRMVTGLSKRVKEGNATADEKQTLSLYQSLPRFSEMKDQVLKEYLKDKKCGFINTMKMELQNQKSTSTGSIKGYATEMEIADHLKLDRKDAEDKVLLKKFLETLTSDNAWDEQDQKQAGYKAAGLLRYHINFTDTAQQLKETDTLQDTIGSHSTGASSVGKPILMLAADAPTTIKLQMSEEYLELQRLVKVLQSGENKVVRTSQEMMKLKQQVNMINNPESPSRASSCNKSIQCLTNVQEKVVTAILKFEAVPKDLTKEEYESHIVDANALVEHINNHCDAAKAIKTKVSDFLKVFMKR